MIESIAEIRQPVADPEDWLAANDAVVRLGLQWIDQRLAGDSGEIARADYKAARLAMAADGSPCGLDHVARCFGLSPFEEDTLLIALAPHIDGALGARYGAAQGRLVAASATPHLLALLLFDGDRLPTRALHSLTGEAPLRRFALIALDETAELATGAAITLPERVREALLGLPGRDPALGQVARPLDAVPLPDRMEALATRIARAAATGLRLQLVGRPGSGRSALAVAVLGRLGLGALAVTADGRAAALAPMIARDAMLSAQGIVLEVDSPGDGAAVARVLSGLVLGPLLIVGEAPARGLEAIAVVRLGPLDPDERAALWRRSGAGLGETSILPAAEQFALGPAQIDAMARQPGLAERGLWAACRDLCAGDLEELSTRILPARGWDDIVLSPETRQELEVLAAQVTGRPRVNGDWGYRRLLGRATGVSALFAGPSGTGKTMAAEVIAGQLELDLYVVDLARVTSKYIGETQKNLRRIFDAAESGGAVLFFDEAEALFGKRSEVKDSHDRYANAEISYLLQRMESYGGLAILATNLKSHLDTAFLRRLRMIVDFPLPDVTARRSLWRRAIPDAAPRETLDWEWLARLDLSGGAIVTIAANAAFRAAAEPSAIGMRHLVAAVAGEYRKLDRDASAMGPTA